MTQGYGLCWPDPQHDKLQCSSLCCQSSRLLARSRRIAGQVSRNKDLSCFFLFTPEFPIDVPVFKIFFSMVGWLSKEVIDFYQGCRPLVCLPMLKVTPLPLGPVLDTGKRPYSCFNVPRPRSRWTCGCNISVWDQQSVKTMMFLLVCFLFAF